MTLASLRRRVTLAEALAAVVVPAELLALLPLWLAFIRRQEGNRSEALREAHDKVAAHLRTITAPGHRPTSGERDFVHAASRQMEGLTSDELRALAGRPAPREAEEEDDVY